MRDWPPVSLLLHTVARQEPGEPLEFGVWELAHRDGPWMGGRRGVFYADDLPAEDVAALRTLCAARGFPEPEPRRRFVQTVLYRQVFKYELPLAGWFLPEDLGRLAADWARADNGGFSLIMWTLPKPKRRKKGSARRRPVLANGEVENGRRPRIVIRMLDGQRPLVSLTKTFRPDEVDLIAEGSDGLVDPRYGKPGRFLTLAMLASSLAGRRIDTLNEACEAFGVAPPAAISGSGLAARFEQALEDLGATGALQGRLLDEHDRIADGLLASDRVYSSASYGRAWFDASGAERPLARNPKFPREALAAAMGAFFGGECAVTVRTTKEPLPCLFLDYTSGYPVVARLQHADRVLKADRLDVVVEEDPAEVAAWLATVTDADLLNPQLHEELAMRFVELTPDGQWLPHRLPAGKHWKTQLGPLHSNEPLWYPLQDVLRASLLGGPPPRIARAFGVVAPGQQDGLRPVRLPSGQIVGPEDDLLFALARERLDGGSWLGAKACANSCCSGLFAQINDNDTPGKKTLQHVWYPDGRTHSENGSDVETPGPWYLPPLAASITAGQRLLLHLMIRLVEQAGGTIAYRDTDSLAVVATPEGGLIPCPGGPHRDDHGRECIRALSFTEVEAICHQLEPLNPYRDTDGKHAPPLLKIEDDNLDNDGRLVQAYLHARSTKNYDRYQLAHDENGVVSVRLTKPSEHGLGHLHPHWPNPGDWIRQGREYLLKTDLGLPASRPDSFDDIAVSIIRNSDPCELNRPHASTSRKARAAGPRPFSRIAVAHTDPFYRDQDGERVIPVALWHDGLTPETATWHNLRDGRPLTIQPASDQIRESDLSAGGPVPVQTMRDVFNRVAQRHDHALDHNGHPVGPHTSGLITPAATQAVTVQTIGRETTDADRVGITNDPAYRSYSDPARDAWQLARDTLRILAPGLLPPGRPRESDKPYLIRQAGELARRELAKLTDAEPPTDPVVACHLYLTLTGRLRIVCDGCGRRLGKRERRWCAACRIARRRLARQTMQPLSD